MGHVLRIFFTNYSVCQINVKMLIKYEKYSET